MNRLAGVRSRVLARFLGKAVAVNLSCLAAYRALINAHVLPRAFFARMAKADGALQHLELGRHAKRSWTGFYDQEILCEPCDNSLSSLDEYGTHTLLTSFDAPEGFHRDSFDRIVAIDGAHIDRERLLRFLVSVLWRAALSRKGPYRPVDLGPYLAAAAETSRNFLQPVPDIFDAVLVNWLDDTSTRRVHFGVLDCSRHRWTTKGPWMFRLHFGFGLALIKVGQAEISEDLQPLSLRHAEHLVAPAGVLSQMKDWDNARMIVMANNTHRSLRTRRR